MAVLRAMVLTALVLADDPAPLRLWWIGRTADPTKAHRGAIYSDPAVPERLASRLSPENKGMRVWSGLLWADPPEPTEEEIEIAVVFRCLANPHRGLRIDGVWNSAVVHVGSDDEKPARSLVAAGWLDRFADVAGGLDRPGFRLRVTVAGLVKSGLATGPLWPLRLM